MQNQLAIGVDLGGTKIAFVLVDEQGAVRASHQLPTAVNDGVEAVIDRIAHGIQHLREQAGYPVIGIGIGSPGHLNPLTGVVHNAVNLGWREVPLVAALQRRLSGNVPIWLQKDTNAALLGELYFGAARDGDPLANVVLNEAADWLGMAFAQCAVVLNPALFVISGGLGLAAADLLLERAEREFRRRVSLPVYQNLRFVQSQITVSAIGAACLVWHALK